MKPGEYLLESKAIEANVGRKTARLLVKHTGDRPVQIGSHYHFFEVHLISNVPRRVACA
jgi:urease beta subunit